MVKTYNISLDEEVVLHAKKCLAVGQKLSPVINSLLKEWIEKTEQQK